MTKMSGALLACVALLPVAWSGPASAQQAGGGDGLLYCFATN